MGQVNDFWYWRMWTENGSTYAARIEAPNVNDARKRHQLALGWSWCHGDMTDPTVSALKTRAGAGQTDIADGDDRDRPVGNLDPRTMTARIKTL
jgi:hypothetical protein